MTDRKSPPPMTMHDAATSPTTAPKPGPSIHVVRARKLLLGGLVGGLAASVICLIAFTIAFGTSGLASAALAAAMTLFFYVVGQLVMVKFADAGARTLLIVSMTSYTARVFALGVVLLVYNRYREQFSLLEPLVIFVTTIIVVIGWLAVEVWVFSRLRITAYDTPYEDPSEQDLPS